MHTKIPESLLRFTNNQSLLKLNCHDYGDWKQVLLEEYPRLFRALFKENELESFVRLLLNEKLVSEAALSNIIFSEKDCIEIITAISGG